MSLLMTKKSAENKYPHNPSEDPDTIKLREYLINKMFFGDRKSVENVSKGILNGIDGSKAQMLNKNINPQQLPYYIVWDFDLIKDLDINTLVRNLQRKITPER